MILMELERIWKKRSYLFTAGIIILLQLLILWYGTISKTEEIPITGYKKLNQQLRYMSEEEKGRYLAEEKELLDAMLFEQKTEMYLSQDSELGEKYVEMVLNKNREYYEKYLDLYKSGKYLKYTEDLFWESELINQACEEYEQIHGYDAYVKGITANQDMLGKISIFAKQNQEKGFSQKNIERSAREHKGMESISPHYLATKGIEKTLEFSITDVFAIVLVVYFAMLLVWEEKETGLNCVTRATKRGRGNHIFSKLAALVIQAMVTTLGLFAIKFFWYGFHAGFIDLSMPIQSVVAYIESSLRWNLAGMMLAVYLSKMAAVLMIGLFIMLMAQRAKMVWMPWLATVFFMTGEIGCYELFKPHTPFEVIRYLSIWGLIKSEKLYGSYININIMGAPVCARKLCLVVQLVLLLVLIVANVVIYLFFYQDSLVERKSRAFQIKALGRNLFQQETYKIFVMNKAIVVIALMLILTGTVQMKTPYHISENEIYYRTLMLKLEGELDEHKKGILDEEQHRFDDAEEQLANIEQLLTEEKISPLMAEGMKDKYKIILSFYPEFEKVLSHYERAKEEGIPFLYDTGYRKVLWIDGRLELLAQELLIASIAITLAFAAVFVMEEEKQSLILLGATARGRASIWKTKLAICGISATALALYGWFFRYAMIERSYPMRNVMYSSRCLLKYNGIGMPLVVCMGAEILAHILLYLGMMAVVLLLSRRRKKTVEVYVYASIILVVPLVILCLLF